MLCAKVVLLKLIIESRSRSRKLYYPWGAYGLGVCNGHTAVDVKKIKIGWGWACSSRGSDLRVCRMTYCTTWDLLVKKLRPAGAYGGGRSPTYYSSSYWVHRVSSVMKDIGHWVLCPLWYLADPAPEARTGCWCARSCGHWFCLCSRVAWVLSLPGTCCLVSLYGPGPELVAPLISPHYIIPGPGIWSSGWVSLLGAVVDKVSFFSCELICRHKHSCAQQGGAVFELLLMCVLLMQ